MLGLSIVKLRPENISKVFFLRLLQEQIVRFRKSNFIIKETRIISLSITDTTKRFLECGKADDNSVSGKIKHFASFWEQKLKASKFTMDIIRNGYILPFENTPPPFYAQNNKSSLRETKFVEESILKLLTDGCIRSVKEPPHCINPLTVAERNSKLRLVLDLRHVNKHIRKPKKRQRAL